MAKASFETALHVVLSHEGGYADHPSDPGGATMRGITLVTYADWLGRPVTKAELRAIRPEEVALIYRQRYWDAIRGDDLPSGVDLALFDLAVNSGPKRAGMLVQQVLGLACDGRIGPTTLTAIRESSPKQLIRRVSGARLAFLEGLATFPTFGRGWRRRIVATEKAAIRLVEENAQPKHKEKVMFEAAKTFLASRTLWANAIGMVALALSWFGFDTQMLDKSALTEAIFQIVAGISFVASSVFRVFATRRLV
ncbi:MAG: glycoside hydrolase family 108 protein [Proteobacteria bacterium]|nr:glycoside hydrolase family 108 protein [Pseudomonadota bacterium]